MKVNFIDSSGCVLESVETNNIEISDDLGFNIDYLRDANDNIPEGAVRIEIDLP